LVVVFPGIAIAGVVGTLFFAPAEQSTALIGWFIAILVVGAVAFGANAHRVVLDSERRQLHVRHFLTGKRHEVSASDVTEVKESRGRGAGIWIICRDGRRIGIPYAGISRGRKLYQELAEWVPGPKNDYPE
jgi:hypothetical protein